ncbi:MAG TPA: Crp/Fnr family transcriptional regulator [Acidimicrobiia bacterium]|jgi:CRP-like cAMP-binding protein|nr:Crp/Fnr family transcriptional regulator [Acidimicrobiia bacterium]
MQVRRAEDPTEPFAALPRALAEQLASRATTRRYRRGDYICHAGETATRLFIVQSGRIAIAVRSRDGRESVAAVLGPRSLFGELPFFDGEPRSSDARALTPVVLSEIEYEAVRAVVDQQPSLLWDVTLILTRRLRATDEALADAMFLDVTGRTAKRILQIAGADDEFSLPVTQEELAAMVGASRERVNKAIATFVRLGWLQVSSRTRYRILDRAELEARTSV